MEIYKNIGKNITMLLEEKNMKPIQLADKLGISKQVITKIIKGNKAINGEEIRNISKILGVTTDKLMKEKHKQEETMVILKRKVNNPNTKDDLVKINTIINEILYLEELLNFKKGAVL